MESLIHNINIRINNNYILYIRYELKVIWKSICKLNCFQSYKEQYYTKKK